MPLPDVTILDVGHGNTALLKAEGWVCLIDVSPSVAVVSELEAQGIRHVDDVLISHAEHDHVGGLHKLIENPSIGIGHVWINPDPCTDSATWRRLRTTLWDRFRSGEVKVTTALNEGTTSFHAGGLRVEVLHPDIGWSLSGVGSAADVNSMSVVLKIWIDEVAAVLLCADLTRNGLDRLNGIDLKAQVLVFPHHGGHSGSADDAAFATEICSRVAPEVVVFSLGRRKEPNPQPAIVAGVRAAVPDVHIACSQLSIHCAAVEAGWDDTHLSSRSSAGRATGVCCAGSITISCVDGALEFSPTLAAHRGFVDSVEVRVGLPLCRRE